MDTVLQIAKNSGYPQHLISKVSSDFTNETHHKQYGNPKQRKPEHVSVVGLCLNSATDLQYWGLF